MPLWEKMHVVFYNEFKCLLHNERNMLSNKINFLQLVLSFDVIVLSNNSPLQKLVNYTDLAAKGKINPAMQPL